MKTPEEKSAAFLAAMTPEQRTGFYVALGVVAYVLLSRNGHFCVFCKKRVSGPHGCAAPPAVERLAGAWRGKGSMGAAPFGKQSSHRR